MAQDVAIAFLDIRSREELAAFLGVKLNVLTMYAYAHERKKSFYSSFVIGKKSDGENRRIDAPTMQLKGIQRKIAGELDAIYTPPACVHGFLKGRSIVSNAGHHVGSPIVLRLDLKDFFPSISEKRIQGLFRAAPFSFPPEVASALAGLCCYRGSLPQGAPSSPVLSNMICLRMDKQLSSFAHYHRVYYTRYADDIAFSGKSMRAVKALIDSNSVDKLCPELRETINKNGFQINALKTHIARKTERQTVTGIVVNRKCNYPRDEYRTLRVVFHNWKAKSVEYAAAQYVAHEDGYRDRLCSEGEEKPSAEAFKRHIRGRLEYYSMIDAANLSRSTSLERLWTMYHDLTGEKVRYSIPARSVLCINAYYEYEDPLCGRHKEEVSAEGSCFVTSDGRLVTCWHAIANLGMTPELPDDCLCDITMPGTGKHLCSIPVNQFTRSSDRDFAIAALPDELKDIPALAWDTNSCPVIEQEVRAFGMLYEHGGVREIACRIAGVFVDGEQYRVAAPFIKGMSGGPVVARNGKVIGVITRGSTPDDYTQDGYFLWSGAALKDVDGSVGNVGVKASS